MKLARLIANVVVLSLANTLFAADEPAAPGSTQELPPCCREPMAVGNYTDRSLYQLESKWTSDVGREIRLGTLRGHPQVVALFFTSCEYACPIIVHDMKRIDASLPVAQRGKVEFLLVSLDSDRDTVAALHQYRQKEHLPVITWTLVRGGSDDVRELAALLGVNYQKDARGQFAHSNVITVLNAEGEIVHQQIGLNGDPSSAVSILSR